MRKGGGIHVPLIPRHVPAGHQQGQRLPDGPRGAEARRDLLRRARHRHAGRLGAGKHGADPGPLQGEPRLHRQRHHHGAASAAEGRARVCRRASRRPASIPQAPARALGDLRAAGRCAVRARPSATTSRCAKACRTRRSEQRSIEQTWPSSIIARPAGKRLKDKVCIVTGAGQGIGRAAAKRLGAEGGTIVVADRVDEGATQTMAELHEHGVDAMKVLVDLGTLTGAKELMSKTVAAYGRIDVLVNNVGGTIWIKPFHLYTEDEVKLELRALALSDAVVLPRGAADHDEAAVRLDRESRLAIDARALPAALRHQQGRHPGADQGDGDGIRPLRHPHQRDGAGRHRDFRPRGAAAVHQARASRSRSPTPRPNTAARWPRTSATSRRCGGAACRRSRRRRSRSLPPTMRASSPAR